MTFALRRPYAQRPRPAPGRLRRLRGLRGSGGSARFCRCDCGCGAAGNRRRPPAGPSSSCRGAGQRQQAHGAARGPSRREPFPQGRPTRAHRAKRARTRRRRPVAAAAGHGAAVALRWSCDGAGAGAAVTMRARGPLSAGAEFHAAAAESRRAAGRRSPGRVAGARVLSAIARSLARPATASGRSGGEGRLAGRPRLWTITDPRRRGTPGGRRAEKS